MLHISKGSAKKLKLGLRHVMTQPEIDMGMRLKEIHTWEVFPKVGLSINAGQLHIRHRVLFHIIPIIQHWKGLLLGIV